MRRRRCHDAVGVHVAADRVVAAVLREGQVVAVAMTAVPDTPGRAPDPEEVVISLEAVRRALALPAWSPVAVVTDLPDALAAAARARLSAVALMAVRQVDHTIAVEVHPRVRADVTRAPYDMTPAVGAALTLHPSAPRPEPVYPQQPAQPGHGWLVAPVP
jgi:hypothetical protein